MSSVPASLPLANNWDVDLVGCLENVPCVLLVEEKIFVYSEVSDRCPDIQKLFSSVRYSCRNIMYKISYKKIIAQLVGRP